MPFAKTSISLLTTLMLLGGCSATQPGTSDTAQEDEYGKTKTGALLGAVIGAAAGALIKKDNRGQGALIGAAVGGAAGAGIGYSLDRQAKEVAESLDTTVSQSDISGDSIVVTQSEKAVKVTFKSAMMFATNSDVPTADAREKIAQMSEVLKKYPSSIVQVVGHTDNRGSYDYNLGLSERRATNVAQTMLSQGLQNAIYARGCSFDKPLLANTNEENMAQNRRVEIFLYQNEADVIDQCR